MAQQQPASSGCKIDLFDRFFSELRPLQVVALTWFYNRQAVADPGFPEQGTPTAKLGRQYCSQTPPPQATSGSRGTWRPGPPWSPDLEAPLIQFAGPVYNLRAKQWILRPFFHIFSKKFLALLHLASVLHSSLTLHIISYFILCAYFYIILTQAITFLVCKDWSKEFLHTNVWKFITILNKFSLKVQQKSLRIVGIHILRLKTATASGGPK